MGFYSNEKVFIKIGQNDATVENEYYVLKSILNVQLDFVAPIVCGSEKLDNNTVMIAVKYLPGLRKFSLPDTKTEFTQLCENFYLLLKELRQNSIIHADIHEGNLMLQDKRIILLDFGISFVKGKKNSINYKHRPGTFFREKDGVRRYDDAYSFVCLLDRLCVPIEWKKLEQYKKIVKCIDEYYVDVCI